MSKRSFGTIRRLPSGRWQARYYHPVTNERHTAPDTFPTKGDAARYLTLVEADLERGVWRDPQLGKVTFAAWAKSYMQGAVHKRSTTRKTNESNLRAHIIPFFGSMPLAAITPLDSRRFVEKLVADGLAPSTIRTLYAAYRAVMNAAVAADILAVSPCRGVKLPAKTRGEIRVLTADDLTRLADAMEPAYRPMVYIGGVLGLRWSEVAGLRVGRLDLLRGTLLVAETAAFTGDFADVKTASSRRLIPIPAFLTEMLAEHLAARGLTAADKDALVFVAQRGNRLRIENWRKRVWLPATEKAGLPGYHFHWLRHTSVALMVELDTHPRVIQERLGHSSWATTMDTYGHILEATDDGVTGKLDGMFRPSKGARKPAGD